MRYSELNPAPILSIWKAYYIWYSELFDIVNKKGLADLFAISRFEFSREKNIFLVPPIKVKKYIILYLWNVTSFKQIRGLENFLVSYTIFLDGFEKRLNIFHEKKCRAGLFKFGHSTWGDLVDQFAQDNSIFQHLDTSMIKKSRQNLSKVE